jgi:hypothetical protein
MKDTEGNVRDAAILAEKWLYYCALTRASDSVEEMSAVGKIRLWKYTWYGEGLAKMF